MNNILLAYREFGMEDAPTIKDSFCKEPYDEKNFIIEYLKHGTSYLPAAGSGIDAFTGKTVLPMHCLMSDGEYSWDNVLIYYIEVYNYRPPQEFVDKVLSSNNG